MSFCDCCKEKKGACIALSSVFTIFYMFALWGTYRVDVGMFNLIAYILGPVLLVLWYVTLSCEKKLHLW